MRLTIVACDLVSPHVPICGTEDVLFSLSSQKIKNKTPDRRLFESDQVLTLSALSCEISHLASVDLVLLFSLYSDFPSMLRVLKFALF